MTEITPAVLEKCLDRVAGAINRAGSRGIVYLPIYERIEREIDTLRSRESKLDQIRRRLERSRG